MGEHESDFRDPWDRVYLEALRQGQFSGDRRDLRALEQYLTPEDEQAWAARGMAAAKRLLARSATLAPAVAGAGGMGTRPGWATSGSGPQWEGAVVEADTAANAVGTTIYDAQPSSPTWHRDEQGDDRPLDPLIAAYRGILDRMRLDGDEDSPLLELIGRGGQGVVFRTECRGSDGFAFPAAVKVFSPERFPTVRSYENAMRRSARVASLVAAAPRGNVVGVQGFGQRQGVRLMFMDLVDGYDLRFLLSLKAFERVRRNCPREQWEKIHEVVVTEGPEQPRLFPGVAVSIIRDCLIGLSLLHRLGTVHGDIKPENVMLQRGIGHAEIVDLGSAFEVSDMPSAIIQTPAYAAPEAIDGGAHTPRSDLASLGYVLVELLAGKQIFRRDMQPEELLAAKRSLPQRLCEFLPERVAGSWKLRKFCAMLTAPQPERRFASADEADLHPEFGASAFLQELVKVGLSAVYDSDIRQWLDAVAHSG